MSIVPKEEAVYYHEAVEVCEKWGYTRRERLPRLHDGVLPFAVQGDFDMESLTIVDADGMPVTIMHPPDDGIGSDY